MTNTKAQTAGRKTMTREAAMAELERRANSPLLCHHSYDLPVSFGEYRRMKAAEARTNV